LRRWLQEPLLHFLLIGAALFALFYLVADPETISDNRIVISEADIDRMITLFERRSQRLPTQQELNGLVEAQIREEILYREALSMGLDQDDTIVRRRMAQKVEFMFNDLVDAEDASDEDLQRFLSENPDRFIESGHISFLHVYINADKRGEKAEADARQLLQSLNQEQEAIDPATVGDPFMLGYVFVDDRSEYQVSRMFGSDFAKSLGEIKPGSWQGPIESGYGLHLVYVKDRTESRLPPLAEIRDSVLNELLTERRSEANQAFYKTLRDRYDVTVELPAKPQSMAGMETAK